jgi:hypothetical protein
MWLATLDTANFRFMAVGDTEAGAREVMREAWNKHREEYRAAWKFEDVADEVEVIELIPGMATRDGEPLLLLS